MQDYREQSRKLKTNNLNSIAKYILAPMAGFTDLPYRLLCRNYGCNIAFTEMISIRGLANRNEKTFGMIRTQMEDYPLILQLFDNGEKYIEQAFENFDPSDYMMIDLNAACPMKKVVSNGAGAALMQEHKTLKKILDTLVKVSPVPVSVKIRTGWDGENINAVDTAKLAFDCGVSAIFIHGRTKKQLYSGEVDYSTIADVCKSTDIPVIASGNIFSPESAETTMQKTACNSVLIARGALGRPWIFEDCYNYSPENTAVRQREPRFIASVMSEHLDMMIDHYGEKKTNYLFRKYFSLYTKTFPGMKHLRYEAFRTESTEDYRDLIHKFSEYAKEAGKYIT